MKRETSLYIVSNQEMMGVGMELSKLNVQYNSDGPFRTAIFNFLEPWVNWKLFLMNCVVLLCISALYVEMIVIQFGQQIINNILFASAVGSWSHKQYLLYISSVPGCQCLWSVVWIDVSNLVYGASEYDAEVIDLCEGTVFSILWFNWLDNYGCKVVCNILGEECVGVSK